MADVREGQTYDIEEAIRAAIDGLRASIWTAMPVVITKNSDGKTAQAKITIKGQVRDADGKLQHVEYPVLQDIPINFIGGGGDEGNKSVVFTHPISEKDEGFVTFMSRPLDNWFEQGGAQNAADLRSHNLSDAVLTPGLRSKPRELAHIDPGRAQLRSVDKKHVISHDPENGTTVRSVKDAQSGQNVDPFEQPKTYFGTHWKGAVSYLTEAVKDGTRHKHELTHTAGHVLDVKNGKHALTAHPDNGAAISAEDGAHKVEAQPGKVKLTSSSKVEAASPLLDVAQNITAGNNISAGNVISAATALTAPLGAFGGLGGIGGGAIGGNLSMGGNVGAGGAVNAGGNVAAGVDVVAARDVIAGRDVTAGRNVDAAGVVSGGMVKGKKYTIGAGPDQLPAASAALEGHRCYVTDASAPTFLAPLVGGGSVVCPAFCNGAAWVAG